MDINRKLLQNVFSTDQTITEFVFYSLIHSSYEQFREKYT